MSGHAQFPEPGSSLLEVGRITKAHGLGGEVIVFLSTDRRERVAAGAHLESPRGTLRVERSRPHQDRWIVKFAECNDRNTAETLGGTLLYAEPLDDDDALWVHELIGRPVVTPDGTHRGVVEAVIDAPSSDLLSLDTGALVPVVFIVDVPGSSQPSGSPDQAIVVDTPDGLFELYQE